MTITLLPVDAVHADTVRRLDVQEDQTDFIASNAESLAELAERPECVGFAVMAADTPVGFAMYALDPDDGNHWIYRLMIDARHQGKGYGSQALAALLAHMATIPECGDIYLGVTPENTRAHALYHRVGFRETGMMLDGEKVMRLDRN
ncbi:GNAT family N-acetyltransferase [Ensifer sp.]|jgi:diamine N-acetyltransferase|uniref:GNAT family N-acetyltransferase n=1 Tax=Ensifer sp. TaxID=1872086 RepID=UPI002E103B82|nr:GNAT family N-acetyltransferase [Ensifer sp.]